MTTTSGPTGPTSTPGAPGAPGTPGAAGAAGAPGTPAYPAHWEADVLLLDGRTARVRPTRATDADGLVAFYGRVSPTSKYLRYFAPHPELTDSELTRWTTLDYDEHVALVLESGERILALGTYDRTRIPGEAEMAFLVDDAHHGRGIGTILLEHLAQTARERAITKFVAEIMPENGDMISTLRAAGYQMRMSREDGFLWFECSVEPTERAVGVMLAREHRAEAVSMQRCFEPASVAVVGASPRAGSVGRILLYNLLTGDFGGRVFAVNPNVSAVLGMPTYASVRDVPQNVDLAVVAVRADLVPQVVEDCAAKGVHGLIIVSSGFAETGPAGREAQQQLLQRVRGAGMRMIGPNCLGIINTLGGLRLNASLSTVMPDTGRVGFFCQTGALGVTILETVARRGLGLSTFVSAGNRADVSGNDLLHYWEEDKATDVVLLYLESLGNARKFSRIARQVGRRKPVVAVRSGRRSLHDSTGDPHSPVTTRPLPILPAPGDQGSQEARPSAGSASPQSAEPAPERAPARSLRDVPSPRAPQAAVDAMFRQAGIIQVDTVDEMFDVAQLLAHQPLPRGRRVAIVGNSYGLEILAAEASWTAGLEVVETTSLGATASARDYADALERLMADDRVDGVVALYASVVPTDVTDAAAALRAAAAGGRKPLVTTFLGMEGVPAILRNAPPAQSQQSQQSQQSRQSPDHPDSSVTAASLASPASPASPVSAGPDSAASADSADRPEDLAPRASAVSGSVPAYRTPETAVRALAKALEYSAWLRRPEPTLRVFGDVREEAARAFVAEVLRDHPDGVVLDDDQTVRLLAYYGIRLLPSRPVRTLEEAVEAGTQLGWNVVLRATDPSVRRRMDIVHSRMHLDGADDLRQAWAELAGGIDDMARAGLVVQTMAAPGVPTQITCVEDPSFGPVIAFGVALGNLDLLGDIAYGIPPLTESDVSALVREVKASKLLFNHRGSGWADVTALEDIVHRVSQLKDALPDVEYLQLGRVLAGTHGASVVSATVRLRPDPASRSDWYTRRLTSVDDGIAEALRP